MVLRSSTFFVMVSLLSAAVLAPARPFAQTSDLVSSARQDSAALTRYEGHFGMNREEVLDYLAGLHVGVLAKSGTYTVLEPGRNGVDISVGIHLSQGEAVFLDGLDEPVLLAEGGFPLTPSLSVTKESAAPVAGAVPGTMTAAASTAFVPSLESPSDSSSWLLAVPVIIPILGMTDSFGNDPHSVNPVPEPAAMATLTLGMVGLARARRKRKA